MAVFNASLAVIANEPFLSILALKNEAYSSSCYFKKYINLMQNYVEKLKPNIGDVWRADELLLKIKRDMKYLFALIG